MLENISASLRYDLDWFMFLAFLGFARQQLSFLSPILGYANQAVLPFYILHQPVLLCIGFFVVQWQIPDLLKYMVIAVPSFMLIIGLYEFLVRRINLMRFMFGIKSVPYSSRLVDSIPNVSGLNL